MSIKTLKFDINQINFNDNETRKVSFSNPSFKDSNIKMATLLKLQRFQKVSSSPQQLKNSLITKACDSKVKQYINKMCTKWCEDNNCKNNQMKQNVILNNFDGHLKTNVTKMCINQDNKPNDGINQFQPTGQRLQLKQNNKIHIQKQFPVFNVSNNYPANDFVPSMFPNQMMTEKYNDDVIEKTITTVPFNQGYLFN